MLIHLLVEWMVLIAGNVRTLISKHLKFSLFFQVKLAYATFDDTQR